MSNTTENRIQDALSQLVDRVLVSKPEEDENLADQRYCQALDRAKEVIDRTQNSPHPLDVHQESAQIRQKLVHENRSPDLALSYNNLFSKLISQPLLTERAGILHFLHQLSEPAASARSRHISPRHLHNGLNGSGQGQRSPVLAPTQFARLRSRGEAAQRHQERRSGDIPSRQSDLPHQHVRGTKPDKVNGDGAFVNRRDSAALAAHPNNYQSASRVSQVPSRPSSRTYRDHHSSQQSQHKPSAPSGPEQSFSSAPNEAELLRDLPFTLQGISSKNMAFTTPLSLILPPALPIPVLSLLHQIAEPALLYRELVSFVEVSGESLTSQSLGAAIDLELRSYLGLIASLEGQIRNALANVDSGNIKRSLCKSGVSLKRCVIWTREATLGLRLLSSLAAESKTRKGGQLISHVYRLATIHGDPFIESFCERLLAHITQPFYEMLRSWIYEGELADPFLEFFVYEQIDGTDGDNRTSGASSVWESKYKMHEDLIPSIITKTFAHKVFLIGKSLNFIRHGCNDSAWVEQYSKKISKELRYGDMERLEVSIDEAYKTTMARLMYLLNQRFQLQAHLAALKKYLLLGQGDFIALLMESLSTSLDRPANSQYRHTLTAQLEHAILNSNAQYESSEVLERLDARMLELSHGEIGWDVFTLEYKIEAPVDVIVTPHASKQYLKIFNFLWRIKHVEYALGSTWRRCMTGARGLLGSIANVVGSDWKLARCVLAEMIHFVNQLQYYILFEVIEASWDQLYKVITAPDITLDDIIQAHAKYLQSIVRKSLLGSTSIDFAAQLHELLKVMLAYRDAADGLYSFSIAQHSRRQEDTPGGISKPSKGRSTRHVATDEDSRTPDKSSGWARDVESPFAPALLHTAADEAVLPALRERLGGLSSEFTSMVCTLLGDLAHQPDTELRFLGVVMNFNETYKVVRRSKRKPTYPESERRRGKEKPVTDESRLATKEKRQW